MLINWFTCTNNSFEIFQTKMDMRVINTNKVNAHSFCRGCHPSTRKRFEETGIKEVVERVGGECVYFDEEPYRKICNHGAKILKELHLLEPLLKADVYINLPKLKVHGQELVSLGIKNQLGFLKLQERLIAHNNISQVLVDMLRIVKPNFTIIDGIWGLQGFGAIPIDPTKFVIKNVNVLVAGSDVVAVDELIELFNSLKQLKEDFNWKPLIEMIIWSAKTKGYVIAIHPNGETVAWPVFSERNYVKILGNIFMEDLKAL